jgi:opacity protein-like surface antigen
MRSLLLSGACAATMLLALTPSAEAADIGYAPPPGGSWYVSVFGGWSMGDEIEADFLGSQNVGWNLDADLDDGFTAGLAVGTQFGEWLRGEIEVSGNWHSADGTLASTASTPEIDDVSGDVDALFLLANLWVEVPLGAGPFRPYAGGGVGIGRLDVDLDAATSTGTASVVNDDDWAFAWQLGAGVAFDVSSNLAIDLGYRFKRIETVDLEGTSFFGATPPEIEVDYTSHNVVVGARLTF